MTLEDFFTLTEMKDGITIPSRVKELINVMQKEKDCMTKSVGDASRQWSTVGSTIATTENRECLDLFIQLNGLWFIDRWLQDAQKLCSDASDSFVEESITALLGALEKLHMDNKKSVSSGIWKTVKSLLGHNSSRVQDRARALFDGWKHDGESDTMLQQRKTVQVPCNNDGIDGNEELSDRMDCVLARGNGSDEKYVEPVRTEKMPSICVNTLQPQSADDMQIQITDETLNHTALKDGPPDDVDSFVIIKPVDANLPIKVDPMLCSVERQSDIPGLTEYTDDAKRMRKNRNSPERLVVTEIPLISSPLKHGDHSSGTDARNTVVSLTESNSQRSIDSKVEFSEEVFPSSDIRTVISDEKSRLEDNGSSNLFRNTMVLRTVDQDNEHCDDMLQGCCKNGKNMGNSGDPETSSSTEDAGAVDEVNDRDSEKSEVDLTYDSDVLMGSKRPGLTEKASDIELDYGMIDPLEVARKVAIEVEREVVDCREPSCTSSEKVSDSGFRQPDSPASTNGKRSPPIEGSSKDMPSGMVHSAEASPMGIDPFREENLGAELEKCTRDVHSSQFIDAARDTEPDAEKGICVFDLNQEVCSEDTDHPFNSISTPDPVVSASRAAAASGSPPLRFEGNLGWKGSAAISAFRPASPLRTSEGDKNISAGKSIISSKQQQHCLDIDLNVAEGGDDSRITDLVPEKPFPALSWFASGESSLEPIPRRSERLKLDLNCVTEEGDAVADNKMEGHLFYHRNGNHSPTPSSSSSSMQPSLRNIDLNDQPLFFSESSDHFYHSKSPQSLNVSFGFKPDDSIISIMGARVEVNRKDTVPQTLPFPNGRISEPGMEVNFARNGGLLGMGSAVPYAHTSSVYGCNGLPSGPNVPLSSTLYGPGGPIPYMVDSRGAPVIPQVVGSTSALPSGFSQPPFIMTLGATPSSSNGPISSRNEFDLNFGLGAEGGNRETGGLRQLFNAGQGRSLDDHLRFSLQPSSTSGGGGKRKEPEGGWEPPSTFNVKHQHHQPPWK